MKSTPAFARETRATKETIPLHGSGIAKNRKATKWSMIRAQPNSQRLDMELCPRRATEANAAVRRPTAAMSGSLLQSTKTHLRVALERSKAG